MPALLPHPLDSKSAVQCSRRSHAHRGLEWCQIMSRRLSGGHTKVSWRRARARAWRSARDRARATPPCQQQDWPVRGCLTFTLPHTTTTHAPHIAPSRSTRRLHFSVSRTRAPAAEHDALASRCAAEHHTQHHRCASAASSWRSDPYSDEAPALVWPLAAEHRRNI
jgi:hypothetical protein